MKRYIKKILSGWARKLHAKWPRRTHSYPLRITLTPRDRETPRSRCMRPRELSTLLRQAGYTDGDRLVVMLERDYQRIHDLACKKVESPVMALALYQLESVHLDRMRRNNFKDIGDYEKPLDDAL